MSTLRAFHVGYNILVEIGIIIAAGFVLMTTMLTFIDCSEITSVLRQDLFNFHGSLLSALGAGPA
jgi:hypothetical protein